MKEKHLDLELEELKNRPIDSEFGKGLCYCLGLFLAHAERLQVHLKTYEKMRKKRDDGNLFAEEGAVEIWFNGAADHLFELEIDTAPEELRKRLIEFKVKCLHWRILMGDNGPTLEDAKWALQEAKDLLRLIDTAHGVSTEKGTWE